ncbi:D-alanyl-D-alanine carboxypeptidase [Streptomyces sp. NPDC001985]|uniref:D-alanyl-D-alanine carboxypeptidase n=1 Tax=Streptomyces sp. NPDC001985 TaxID=3154406 RepID=UPI0033304F7B
MTHGGGTVAGESPDRSEQRKSSGETAQGERDPRPAPLDRAGSSGGDRPTAVVGRTEAKPDTDTDREPEAKPDTESVKAEPEPEADTDTGAAPDRGGEPGTETGSAANDKRLRSAVAAWVASAEDAEDDEDAEKGGSDGEPGASDPAGETAALPETAAEETALLPEVRPEPPEPESEPEPDSEPESEPREEAGKPGAGDEADPGEADETSGPAPVPAPVPVPVPVANEDADAGGAEEGAKGESGDDPDGSGVSGAAGETRTPGAPGKPGKPEASKASEEPEAPGASGKPGKLKASEEPEEPEAPGAPKASGPPAAAKTSAGGEDAPAEDHPTAVFGALRRPAPADDSPTTALKIPPPPRRETNPAPAASPAERPSTFVPLRRDDDVRTPSWSRNDTAGTTAAKAATATAEAPEATAPAAERAPADAPAGFTGDERTSQQPLPPQQPPLDLLAQLTNTPDTPVRTALRRVKIWTPLVLLLLVVFAVAQVLRPLPEPVLTLTADPAYTFKGGRLALPLPGEGQGAVAIEGVGTMATYGAQKPAPIASVTKAMTAYVILKERPITGKQVGPGITIDRRADEEYEKGLNIESVEPVEEGQEYTQREMLEMLMVASANNVARLLARWESGSEKAFVQKMNDAARDLGMKDTVYTDPSGLKESTTSTPLDQLKLAQAAMENDVFADIVNQPQVEIKTLGKTIYNSNGLALLKDGVGGIKTGSSTPAGGNLLWSANARVDGKIHRIVGITMGIQDAEDLKAKQKLAVSSSIRVIEAAQEAAGSATVIRKGDVVGRVDDGLGGQVPVIATEDLKAVGWNGHRVEITLGSGDRPVPGTGAAGDRVGTVSIGSGAGKASVPVALQRDMAEPGFMEKLTRVG